MAITLDIMDAASKYIDETFYATFKREKIASVALSLAIVDEYPNAPNGAIEKIANVALYKVSELRNPKDDVNLRNLGPQIENNPFWPNG